MRWTPVKGSNSAIVLVLVVVLVLEVLCGKGGAWLLRSPFSFPG